MKPIGAGREAEIFAWGEGRVLRLARTPAFGRHVERERLALEAAQSCGAPAPEVYGRVDVEGRPGLVMERLDGQDLLSGMLVRPWELVLAAPIPQERRRLLAIARRGLRPDDVPGARSE